MPRRRALRISGSLIHRSAWNKNSANFAFWAFSEVRLKGVLESGNSKPYSSKALIRFRRTAPPHLPLALDDDACPHIWMYLTVVRLLACTLEGVCVPLSWKQKSGVKRFSVVGRCGVQIEVHVDPSDLRPPLDGDVGRLEAEVLDQDRLGRMFFAMAVGCFFCAPATDTARSVPTTTTAATVINKMMRFISLTSFSFSGPTEETCAKR